MKTVKVTWTEGSRKVEKVCKSMAEAWSVMRGLFLDGLAGSAEIVEE